MTPSKRRGAAAGRPQRLGLSSISASEANTPRRRADAAVRSKLGTTGAIGANARQCHSDEAAATKLWNMLPGSCEYSVADSPHLKLLYPPDSGGVASPSAAESSGPVPSETTPEPADLSHVPMMSHHTTGFLNAAATEPVQPMASPHVTAGTPMLTPDARLQRRRKALASGSFKDGAGALFSNTAHLDLELLGAPTLEAPQDSSKWSHPVGGMLGMVGCVCVGMLLQPIMLMAWPQTVAPLPLATPPAEAALQPASVLMTSDRQPISTPWNNPLLLERQVVQAAAHEWSLLEMSRLSIRLSQAEQERDLLRQQMMENLGTLKAVVAMEMAEHRARVTLEQDVDWLEAELDALSQSEEESWCVGQACCVELCCAVLCCAVLCCAVPCRAVLRSAVLCVQF